MGKFDGTTDIGRIRNLRNIFFNILRIYHHQIIPRMLLAIPPGIYYNESFLESHLLYEAITD